MKLSEVFPPQGHVQSLYCDICRKNLYLAFTDFYEDVSGIHISIQGLPVLRCDACKRDHLPDHSRFVIIEHHRLATEKGAPSVKVTRRKPNKKFNFTNIPFLYDSDDYQYLPGLERPFDEGFLTPVFFNREVLLKYDASPTYRVRFASTTYGDIAQDNFYISFGINKNGKVIMWLGDIAKLPEAEQYYLRSENIESDHLIGSEFYDGQIECVFTEPSQENKLFSLRSAFLESCFKKLGKKIAHLDYEVFNLALAFNAPVIDTERERRHVADTLNKIYVESFDNGALGSIISQTGGDPKGLGSIKRLQAVLETIANGADIPKFLSPFYVLYDLRVAYSHLTSAEKAKKILESVMQRLGIASASGLMEVYGRLSQELSSSFEKLIKIIDTR